MPKKKKNTRWNRYPYGWEYDHVTERLIAVGHEQKAIKLIVQLRGKNKSYGEIISALEQRGHYPRGSQWHRSSIKRILERHDSDWDPRTHFPDWVEVARKRDRKRRRCD